MPQQTSTMSDEDFIKELKSQSNTRIDSLVRDFPKSIANSAGLKASLLKSLESVYSKGHTPYSKIATVSGLQGRTDVTGLNVGCEGKLTEDPLLKGSYICALKYNSVFNADEESTPVGVRLQAKPMRGSKDWQTTCVGAFDPIEA